MTSQEADDRNAFEAQYDYELKREGRGYLNQITNEKWGIWQGALAYDRSQHLPDRVLEGWKLVPVEPTPEMVLAYWHSVNTENTHGALEFTVTANSRWSAMLAAAPTPTKGSG